MADVFNDAQLAAFCKDVYAYIHTCLILYGCFEEATTNQPTNQCLMTFSPCFQSISLEQLMFMKSFWQWECEVEQLNSSKYYAPTQEDSYIYGICM